MSKRDEAIQLVTALHNNLDYIPVYKEQETLAKTGMYHGLQKLSELINEISEDSGEEDA